MSLNKFTSAATTKEWMNIGCKSLFVDGVEVVPAGYSFAFYQNQLSPTPATTNSGAFPSTAIMNLPTDGEFYTTNEPTRYTLISGTGIQIQAEGAYSVQVAVDFECNPGVSTRHYLGDGSILFASSASTVGERVAMSYSYTTRFSAGAIVNVQLGDSFGGNTERIHGFTIAVQRLS
ncbi:MAG: hypothetical protein ACYSUV_08855 [Planctomycetota bacterium]|jgi:hypothetical protein